MEIYGDKAFLTIYEQRKSGYLSPIDMQEFDLHSERSKADAELDKATSLQSSDDITEGQVIQGLEGAQVRSNIARAIGRELATRTAVTNMLTDLDQELGS